MMWAGPPVEKFGDAWRENEKIRGLAEKLAARRTQMEDAKAAIKAFASDLGQDKDRKLSLLFAGALALINTERADIISGIRRYAERQGGLADRIESRAAEIEQIPADGNEGQRTKGSDLEEQQYWDARIFDERQKSLTYICEQPVLLEQRAFALARTIASQLE
jgi:hypothetical protein